jgi:hypothetical protein
MAVCDKVAVLSRVALFLSFLMVSFLSLWNQAQAQNDHLIVPWERIGPIELGMMAAGLIRIKGKPTQTSRGPADGISVYSWKDDLSVYIKTDGSYVTQICVIDPAYTTDKGVCTLVRRIPPLSPCYRRAQKSIKAGGNFPTRIYLGRD